MGYTLLLSAAGAVTAGGCTTVATAMRDDAAVDGPTLHVATLNLAHGRGLAVSQLGIEAETFRANVDAIAAVVKREHPDVLAVQEADGPSAWSGSFHHVQRLASAAGYPQIHHRYHLNVGAFGTRLQYGTGMLASRPLTDRHSHRFRFNNLNIKGFVTARFEFAGRPVMIASVHLASTSAAARRKQVGELVSVLAESDVPLILMGDLNSRWENESDAVRQLASRLKLQAYRPEDPGLETFHASRPRKRIDWILISPRLRFVSYTVWPDTVSDHLGVATELRWAR